MSLLFQRLVKVSGVNTNADSSPTIQIVRLDTSAVVVATTSSGITNPTTGEYQYSLASPVDGVTYRSTWTFIVGGQTIVSTKDITAQASTTDITDAEGYYANGQDLIEYWGEINIAVYSDLENTSIADATAIQNALLVTDKRIDQILRTNNIENPVPTDSDDFLLLNTVSVLWTGVDLYFKRGKRDDESDKRMKNADDEADALMNRLSLPNQLDADQANTAIPTMPSAVDI